ncbi:hypothetical protein CC2G_013840 [Coprinopsis cinerea AmutBmut pab1-1]|nr:hypothetical protein CC2G_013840 [Coprinopsis cinerea AmutBmut pab1-1]
MGVHNDQGKTIYRCAKCGGDQTWSCLDKLERHVACAHSAFAEALAKATVFQIDRKDWWRCPGTDCKHKCDSARKMHVHLSGNGKSSCANRALYLPMYKAHVEGKSRWMTHSTKAKKGARLQHSEDDDDEGEDEDESEDEDEDEEVKLDAAVLGPAGEASTQR